MHLRKKNQIVGGLLDRKEAMQIYDELTERYGTPEDEEYNPAMDVAERVFANFVDKNLIESFRSTVTEDNDHFDCS